MSCFVIFDSEFNDISRQDYGTLKKEEPMARRGENIYKRKDGRWEGRYRLETAKYRSVYGKTYHEVKTKLAQIRPISSSSVTSGNLTVRVLFEEWLTAIQLRVKESTFANYRMKAEKHILPEFGDLLYDSLTVKMLHSFISDKIRAGLSAKYVSDIIIVFKCMAKYISKVHGFRNILADVVLPKVTKKEMKLFSDSQQSALCKYLMNNMDPTALCVLISLYTGLRVGEICGLMWSDINFQKSILTVRRSVQRIHDKNNKTRIIIGTPKSRSSCRTIPIPVFIIKLLRNFRSNENFFILSGNTIPIEPRTLQRRFKTILSKAELSSVSYHCLRHMFATNCISAGFDVKTLSEILGHSSVETTLNRYVHSSIERKTECMNLLRFTV